MGSNLSFRATRGRAGDPGFTAGSVTCGHPTFLSDCGVGPSQTLLGGGCEEVCKVLRMRYRKSPVIVRLLGGFRLGLCPFSVAPAGHVLLPLDSLCGCKA